MYGSTKFATALAMKKEEEGVDQILEDLNVKKRQSNEELIAGRHAFRFASLFSRVHAFDCSTHMINIAKKKKALNEEKKISFSVADFEYEEIWRETEFTGKVDFICASFGMGSFIEDTSRMLRRFHEWLKPGGAALISFYNANTIVESMKPNWRDTSLSAHIDADRQTLQVTLEDMTFYIFCKAYTPSITEQIRGLFEIKRLISYPCLAAILPNTMFETESAKEYFSFIDSMLMERDDYFYGHYVLVYVVKRPDASGQERIRSFLGSRNIEFNTLQHASVLKISDVRRLLGLEFYQMAKTVVFTVKQEADSDYGVAIAVM